MTRGPTFLRFSRRPGIPLVGCYRSFLVYSIICSRLFPFPADFFDITLHRTFLAEESIVPTSRFRGYNALQAHSGQASEVPANIWHTVCSNCVYKFFYGFGLPLLPVCVIESCSRKRKSKNRNNNSNEDMIRSESQSQSRNRKARGEC